MIFLALMLLVGGVIAIASSLRNYRRLRRVRATPTTSIELLSHAEAFAGQRVEINGHVVGAVETFMSPISRRPAVWCRVHSERYSTGGDGKGSWSHRALAVHGVPFLVSDGTGGGKTARVVPARAVAPHLLAGAIESRTCPPALDEFFDAHRTERTETLDTRFAKSTTTGWQTLSDGDARYVEEVIGPGDFVYAMGVAQKPSPEVEPYREAKVAPVVEIVAGDGAENELLLSRSTEQQLRGALGAHRAIGIAMIAIAGILGAISFFTS
jgi:hypothetical protein